MDEKLIIDIETENFRQNSTGEGKLEIDFTKKCVYTKDKLRGHGDTKVSLRVYVAILTNLKG